MRPDAAYASSSIGNLTHLAAELFNSLAGIKMLHVPYKGGNPAMLDLLGARVSVFFSTVAVARPHLQTGRIKGLGVTTARRSLALPDVPTIAESGLPGYAVSGWYGLVAPAATPKAAVGRLPCVLARAVAQPDGLTDVRLYANNFQMEIRHYLTASGRDLYQAWLDDLKDMPARGSACARGSRSARRR